MLITGNKITSINEINTLRRWIAITCDTSKLGVKWTNGNTPYTTKNTIHIPRFNANLTDKDVKRLRFYVLHECGHHTEGPEYFELAGNKYKVDIRHPFGAIANMIEDQRIERSMSGKFTGDAQTISDGREILNEDAAAFARKMVDQVAPNDLHDNSAKMQAVYFCMNLAQAEWCNGARFGIRKEIETICDHFEQVQDYLNTCRIELDLISKINNTKSAQGSWDLAEYVYKTLWNLTDEQFQQELEEFRKQGEGDGDDHNQEGQGSSQSGEGRASGERPDEGDNSSSNASRGDQLDDSLKAAGGVDPRSGKYKLKYEHFVKTDHGQFQEGQDGHGLGLDYTAHAMTLNYIPESFDEMTVVITSNNQDKQGSPLRRYSHDDEADFSPTPAFTNKVRRYLQVKTEDSYIGGQKRGAINTRQLYRAGLPQVADGDWNKKVFRIRDENDMLDTSVTLLCDFSGSMSGTKVVQATKAAIVLNHVISNTLHVNTEILTFSYDSCCIMGVVKAFNQRVSDDKILEGFSIMSNRMWGNNDADAIMFAYDRLLKQQTKRKVMIVLSDGSPADGVVGTDPYYALRYVVGNIEQEKKCDIIGIGILDDSVKEFYQKHVIVKSVDALEQELLTIISNNIAGVN